MSGLLGFIPCTWREVGSSVLTQGAGSQDTWILFPAVGVGSSGLEEELGVRMSGFRPSSGMMWGLLVRVGRAFDYFPNLLVL